MNIKGYEINNAPEYAENRKYVVCRCVGDELYFYDAFDDKYKAACAAEDCSGRVIETQLNEAYLNREQIEKLRNKLAELCYISPTKIRIWENGRFEISDLDQSENNSALFKLRGESDIYKNVYSSGKYDFNHFSYGLTDAKKYTITGDSDGKLEEKISLDKNGNFVSTIDKNHEPKENYSLDDFDFKEVTPDMYEEIENQSFANTDEFKDAYTISWWDGDKLVAILSEFDDQYNERWISYIEVTKKYRNHNLSKQLLDYAVNELGCTTLGVAKTNKLALKVYQDYGFDIVEENPKNKEQYIMKINKAKNPTNEDLLKEYRIAGKSPKSSKDPNYQRKTHLQKFQGEEHPEIVDGNWKKEKQLNVGDYGHETAYAPTTIDREDQVFDEKDIGNVQKDMEDHKIFVKNISLITTAEVKLFPSTIRRLFRWDSVEKGLYWWLVTDEGKAAYASKFRYVPAPPEVLENKYYVKPVLTMSRALSDYRQNGQELKLGDVVILFGKQWCIIDKNKLFALDGIGESCWDMNKHLDFEGSDIQKYLNDWLNNVQ